MSISETYREKASLPREARNATNLRDALRMYAEKRLLHVADVCGEVEEDAYRKEYGLIHRRYARCRISSKIRGHVDSGRLRKRHDWSPKRFCRSLC